MTEYAIRSPSDVAAYLAQSLKSGVLYVKRLDSTIHTTIPPYPKGCPHELWTTLFTQQSAYMLIKASVSPEHSLEVFTKIFIEHCSVFPLGLHLILFDGTKRENRTSKNSITSTLVEINADGEILHESFDNLKDLSEML